MGIRHFKILWAVTFLAFSPTLFFIGVGRCGTYFTEPATPTPTPTATLSPTSTHTPIPGTSPPAIARFPDIRHPVNESGGTARVFRLNDYVVDGDDRDQTTGAQLDIDWTKAGVFGSDHVTIVEPTDELEVSIPAQASPSFGEVTLEGTDMDGNVVNDAIIVKTADFLLGGPLVDDFMQAPPRPLSGIPYSWCIEEGSPLVILLEISASGGGSLGLNISNGVGWSQFYGQDTIVEATDISRPIDPFIEPVNIQGSGAGDLGGVTVSAANLTVTADLTGLEVTAESGFTDWVRATVTRSFDSGAEDCYTVAIGDFLLGSSENLGGESFGTATILGAAENYGFENITTTDFLGAASSDAVEASPEAAINNQNTSWKVFGLFQSGTRSGSFGTSSLPEISITDSNKPASDFPGATSGRALKIDLIDGDKTGILMHHKGLDPATYAPGDTITMSMNMYVDLNYDGSVSAGVINDEKNGPIIAFALATQPLAEAGNFNYLTFPPAPVVAGFFEAGGPFGPNGAGGEQRATPAAAIHGRWTRHEVSFRVPETGQSVTGPAGTGDIVDPNGVAAFIAVGRNIDLTEEKPLDSHNQTVWIDNICITKCPGAMCLAMGATKIPMISAGWSFEFEDGSQGTKPHNLGEQIPASIARGNEIHGGFSANPGAQNDPTTFLANTANGPFSAHVDNQNAGWMELNFGASTGRDVAFIASGDNSVALDFPILASGRRAMALAPDPNVVGTANYPNPINFDNTGLGHRGTVSVSTPYLDMRLAADEVNPGLNVADAVFEAGTGGDTTPDRFEENVSGVFGVRFFHRTNAQTVNHNPLLAVILSNVDSSLGLVAQRQPSALTAPMSNMTYSGDVWIDDNLSGSFITFQSRQRYFDLVVNTPSGRPGWGVSSTGNPTLVSALRSENPGAQLAEVRISRHGANITQALSASLFGSIGLNAYQNVYGTPTAPGGPVVDPHFDAYPGRYSTATVFIDEVSLHAVRDIPAFFDQDLCAVP